MYNLRMFECMYLVNAIYELWREMLKCIHSNRVEKCQSHINQIELFHLEIAPSVTYRSTPENGSDERSRGPDGTFPSVLLTIQFVCAPSADHKEYKWENGCSQYPRDENIFERIEYIPKLSSSSILRYDMNM